MDGVKSPSVSNVAGSKPQLKSNGKGLDGARQQAASPVNGQNRKQQPPQPKAWQGPNPITQRVNSSTPNGTEKPLPKLPPQAQGKSSGDSLADKHAHDRLLFLVAHFTGEDATLTLKNGEQFTGVFSGGAFDSASKNHYVLKMVKRTRLPSHQQVNGTIEMPDEYAGDGEDHVMTFDVQDTIDLAVADVTTTSAQPAQNGNGSISSTFRTDTEISQRDAPVARQRELQRWDAGADSSIDMSLGSSGETGWDQFAANERMYGVQSSYDESYYTTAIDRNNPQYRQREAEAARIAREIEGSAAANPHVAEERRRDTDKEDGLDEEDKYSGVRREGAASSLPKRGAGSYVPPSQRPITGTPTVPGAPFDPAIISTSKPVPSAPSAPPSAPVAAPEKPSELSAAAAPSIEQPKLQPAVAGNASRDTSVPASVSSQASRKPTEQTAEDHMRKAADAFKEFANMEKLKARAAQEQKKSHIRQEKSVKLNDLKKFAMNFKLNTRVPDDLVPILAKDREKQTEIQNKAEELAKEAEVKAEQKQKEKKIASAGVTPPAPAPTSAPPSNATTSQPPPPPASDPRLPFNQHSRTRVSQQMRGAPLSAQGQSPRAPLAQRLQQSFGARGGIAPPLPPMDLRIPTGPAAAADRAPLSPASSIGLNVNAPSFEFRPVASAFTPSGTSPSPQRVVNSMDTPSSSEATASFFGKDKKPTLDRKDAESSYNPIKRMTEEEPAEEYKKSLASNGGVPQPYRTPPTWSVIGDNANVSYRDAFPKSQAPSQGQSPMHTPNPNGPMPHSHQLPVHLQAPQISTPQQRPPYYAQQHHGQAPPPFDPRMQQFGPNGSVQSSPRFPPANLAFNGQMQHMQMPQFAGQPMPAYGMSPSMGYRQPLVMQGGPMMMPGHQQGGQMPQMRQGFPQGGPQYGGPPMGGQMMVPNPSGGYMNGPMPQQQYSPMPPHAQPHLPHMQGAHGGPGGFSGSPRPPMMQQQGSHQGFQPQMHGHGPPQFAPSPGQPHPYHYQRQMSGQGYPQMTPRQQQAMPQHPSPGMGAPGDEGK
ncbi:hypothetical protein LTR85_010030 [Meristemomyces frigidus]|nr:hypothetical protein LTR85_010030 [Meristemomyces frigidus]